MYVLYSGKYPYRAWFTTLLELVDFIATHYVEPIASVNCKSIRTYYIVGNRSEHINTLVSRILHSRRREARNGTINKTAAHKSLN